MNYRRKLVIAFGAGVLTAPFGSFAQPQKVYRVGVLLIGTAAEPNNVIFTEALRELGYVEGKNVVIERRFAEGIPSHLPALATDLIQQKVDVIYAAGTGPAKAAKDAAAGHTAVVFVNVADPIGSGLVGSLARPTGNVTGTAVVSNELSAKRLQILKEAFPGISRVAVITSNEAIAAIQFAEVERAAKTLGMKVLSIEFPQRGDFDRTFAMLRKWRVDSLYIVETPKHFYDRKALADFAAQMRLPAIYATKYYAEAGGLMSYGSNYEYNYRYAATYVDKILKGAKPVDLPVEQPTIFELVFNMKAAKALGIKMPQSILVRADKVIE